MPEKNKGSLTCVGTGIILGAHLTQSARHSIESAEIVFMSVASGIHEQWIESMNSNVVNLQQFYAEGKSRLETYKEMVQVILDAVRAGKKACCAFYGHPGVFALAGHKAIKIARSEGFAAKMEPGISAADCIYADLGIDPAKYGCQYYEASQFMFYSRVIDPSSYLILWQVGVAGDRSYSKFESNREVTQLLVDLLLETYPADHKVVLYESKSLSFMDNRVDNVLLDQLASQKMALETTLVIPPSKKMNLNKALIDKLDLMNNSNLK